MDEVKNQLAQKALERADKWTPIYVKHFPEVERINEMVLLGSYSFSLPETRRRLIKTTIQITAEARETPSAIGRDYLRLIYKKGPKGTHYQLEATANIQPVPNVAMPQKFAHGLYVDIKSCYWSIMQIIGWDVDYNPGQWLSPGRPPFDYPFPDHKIGRNCLVSAGRTGGIPRYMPKKLPNDPYDEIMAGNPLSNTQLSKLISDVLNSIMTLCVAEGAIYANNDGLIAPTPGIAATCIRIIEDWGLTSTIKGEGSGQVKASGSYQVGGVASLPFRITEAQTIENLFPPSYARWLYKQFSFFAREVK